MPKLRTVLQDRWEPREEPQAVVELLEVWAPLLPRGIYSHLLDQVIVPRLARALEAWDPRADRVPVHGWLYPWLPLAGDRLQPLYAKLRFKLGACLRAWEPSDTSALAVLSPWSNVWSAKDMRLFLSRTVTPKLRQALQGVEVNPAAQRYEMWQAVLAWHKLVAPADMAALLVEAFFPQFMRALCAWLSEPTANLNEIADWYLAWKGRLPTRLQRQPRVRRQLQNALQVMDRAVQGAVTDVAALAARYDTLEVAVAPGARPSSAPRACWPSTSVTGCLSAWEPPPCTRCTRLSTRAPAAFKL